MNKILKVISPMDWVERIAFDWGARFFAQKRFLADMITGCIVEAGSLDKGVFNYIAVSATYVILAGSPLKINPNQFGLSLCQVLLGRKLLPQQRERPSPRCREKFSRPKIVSL